jgi:hypothetical protein
MLKHSRNKLKSNSNPKRVKIPLMMIPSRSWQRNSGSSYLLKGFMLLVKLLLKRRNDKDHHYDIDKL